MNMSLQNCIQWEALLLPYKILDDILIKHTPLLSGIVKYNTRALKRMKQLAFTLT